MKLDIGINKVDKIFHLADIHIRTLRRHKEYRQVFIPNLNIQKNKKT